MMEATATRAAINCICIVREGGWGDSGPVRTLNVSDEAQVRSFWPI